MCCHVARRKTQEVDCGLPAASSGGGGSSSRRCLRAYAAAWHCSVRCVACALPCILRLAVTAAAPAYCAFSTFCSNSHWPLSSSTMKAAPRVLAWSTSMQPSLSRFSPYISGAVRLPPYRFCPNRESVCANRLRPTMKSAQSVTIAVANTSALGVWRQRMFKSLRLKLEQVFAVMPRQTSPRNSRGRAC